MRKRLLVDVDEVLCDFQTPMFDVLFERTGRRMTPNDCNVWDCFSVMSAEEKRHVFSALEQPGWCTGLRPLDGAQAAIQELRKLVDVFAVTNPYPSRTWVHERGEWLKIHFDFNSREIVYTSAKHVVKGDAFLDDNPQHVLDWKAEHPNGLGMLWHIPNTRLLGHDDLRVRSWDEVIARVSAHSV